MAEMNAWEVKTKKSYDEGSIEIHGAKAGEALQKIYPLYLTPKERKLGRLPIPHAGFPPEYDPDCEKITAITMKSAKKAEIETIWTHPVVTDFKMKHLYTLVFKGGSWLIDTKKRYSSANKKWKTIVF